jgi:hypothetical protein
MMIVISRLHDQRAGIGAEGRANGRSPLPVEENVFWEERGVGGKVLVRDQSGVIAQVAATAVPRLVTAAEPRELRVDPCEKKWKETSLGLCDRGAWIVVSAGLLNIAVLPSTPGTARRSSQNVQSSGRGCSLIF